MKILISTWSLQVGGGEVLAMNLAAELTRLGHEVFIFNQRSFLIDREVVRRLLPPEVKILSMADRPLSNFLAGKVNALQQRLGRTPSFYNQQQQVYLAECLQRYKIDVVSSHSTFSDEMCAPVTSRLKIPLVITEHGDYSQFLLDGRRDFLTVLQQARRILTVSNYCKLHLQAAFGNLPPLETVYNGVVVNSSNRAEEMRQTLGIPQDAFVFGMVSRGVEKKGWKYAVQAFQQIKALVHDKPVRLVLVGGSTYLKQLQMEYHSDSDIIFTGQVPNPDFYMAGFDVGLLPTYFRAEALPLAVIEYMVSGKPSIATQVGGVPELIQQSMGPTGLLIDIDTTTYTPDVIQLKEAMLRYCLEPELTAAHAQNARIASKQFTMATCAAYYEQAFQLAVTNSPSA